MSKQKEEKVVMDLDAILDFIFAPDEKRTTDVELEETFVPDAEEDAGPNSMSLIQRIKHEAKTADHSQHEAIRVNLVTRLLDDISELEADGGSGEDDISLGEEIAYNTLFHYGFLKKV